MEIQILKGMTLFQGMKEEEIRGMLTCLSAEEKRYKKGAYIYRIGDVTGRLGVLMKLSLIHI